MYRQDKQPNLYISICEYTAKHFSNRRESLTAGNSLSLSLMVALRVRDLALAPFSHHPGKVPFAILVYI